MNEKQKEITETIKAECGKNEDYQKGFITGMFYAAHISKGDTNFAKVTESPETLAEFIIDKLQYCKRPVCPICPVWQQCDGKSKDSFIEWLKQESE